jgi:protein-S-isoprenylcysteine O-methyltransferase Ste14
MINDFKPCWLEKWGTILFTFRAWIAVPFFVLLVLLSRPATYPLIACMFLISGCTIRLWAAGYIGVSARAMTFRTRYRITNGPYRFLKHPLYVGNFLQVVGTLFLLNPPLLYALLVLVLFIVMYGMIVISEHRYLSTLSERTAVYQLKNCRGEISTIIIVAVIVVIHLCVPKYILY